MEYKDIWSGTQLDPNGTANGGAGLFRDPVYGPGTPENSLSGTIFTVDDIGTLDNISIPASMSQLRFWRNTSIASGNGGTLTNLLGYEWDSDLDNGFRPAGLIDMSSTTRNVDTLLLDNGATTGPGTATHSLTLYRDTTSGALVFGAGTVMWSWGLSNQYVPYNGLTAPVSTAVQQSMVNLFADMGVQPQTLQASLVLAQASTDHTAPTAVSPPRQAARASTRARPSRSPAPPRTLAAVWPASRSRPTAAQPGIRRLEHQLELYVDRFGRRARMSSRHAPPTTASICSRARPR